MVDVLVDFSGLAFIVPFGPQIEQGIPAASCTRHMLGKAAGSQADIACEDSPNSTLGVPCRALPGEERCGRKIAIPSETNLHSKIDPPKLAAVSVLCTKRLRHWRRETAFSPESTARSSEARVN